MTTDVPQANGSARNDIKDAVEEEEAESCGQTSNNNNKRSDHRRKTNNEAYARPSIVILMIRHAESRNNQVYSDARRLFRLGTDQSDVQGWEQYVNQHRRADPELSEIGILQAAALADYLVPMLSCGHRAHVTDVLISPMRRTLATIRPTVQCLQPLGCRVTVHGFYFETEGCHTNGVAEEGMNPSQIEQFLFPTKEEGAKDLESADTGSSSSSPSSVPRSTSSWINTVGFPNADAPTRGWWTQDGSETRAMAEERAAKFYLWLCEHLDEQLADPDRHRAGIFDAGVIPVEDDDTDDDYDVAHHAAAAGTGNNNNRHPQQPRRRQQHRKTQLLIGHGDFMSLVLKRIVGGFGHAVEATGVPHRSAFVHWNTGITELEYFGQGRFLVMSVNSTPHLNTTMTAAVANSAAVVPQLFTGGSLKDGWSFLMPHDHDDDPRVDVVFSDQELDGSTTEQKAALKALYLSSHATIGNNSGGSDSDDKKNSNNNNSKYSVEESDNDDDDDDDDRLLIHHFVVRQGLQVVGVATYAAATDRVFDVAIRPSASANATHLLFNAIQDHAKRQGRSGNLRVQPRTDAGRQLFEAVGFRPSQPSSNVNNSTTATTKTKPSNDEESLHLEYRI